MEYAIEISNLKKTYDNKINVLDGINLKIERGDFFALLGHNGSGKSTTINCIMSLVKKTKGEIKIAGFDIDEEPYKSRMHIGITPQEFNLNMFDSVYNVLKNQAGYFGIIGSKFKEKAELLLQQLQLTEKRNTAVRHLSGGQKRRLLIARSLIHSPEILILDEPTAGVDIEIRHDIWELLEYMNKEQKVTIILTTHYLEEAERLCKHISVIKNGKIENKNTISEMIRKAKVKVFIFDLDKNISNSDIKEIKKIYPQTMLPDDKSIEFTLSKEQDLNKVFLLLDKYGYKVVSMKNKFNRLEEIFMGDKNEFSA